MDLCERTAEPNAQRHPWELARLRFFERLVASEIPEPSSILDIGAGDAWLVDQMVQRMPSVTRATAWDINYTDDDLRDLSALRNVELVRESPVITADVVLLLDVIEHVVDDVALLREALGHLSPRGLLVVSVPAWPQLFSTHDAHLGHERRYTPASLLQAITAADGQALGRGGLFHGLLAPRAAQVAVQRRRRERATAPPDLGQWKGGPALTGFLTAGLDLEARAGLWAARKGVRIPGLSAWCIADRR